MFKYVARVKGGSSQQIDVDGEDTSVLYKIYDYTKNYTKSTICYRNYMLCEDAIIIRVIRKIAFQSFYVDFAVTG